MKIIDEIIMQAKKYKPVAICAIIMGLMLLNGISATTNEVSTTNSSKNVKLYSFQAENLEMKRALALFARTHNLNIIPDLDVVGEVTVDLRDLPLDKVMAAILDAYGYSWTIEENFIRVKSIETKTFVVDYLRLVRSGMGASAVVMSSMGSNS